MHRNVLHGVLLERLVEASVAHAIIAKPHAPLIIASDSPEGSHVVLEPRDKDLTITADLSCSCGNGAGEYGNNQHINASGAFENSPDVNRTFYAWGDGLGYFFK